MSRHINILISQNWCDVNPQLIFLFHLTTPYMIVLYSLHKYNLSLDYFCVTEQLINHNGVETQIIKLNKFT